MLRRRPARRLLALLLGAELLWGRAAAPAAAGPASGEAQALLRWLEGEAVFVDQRLELRRHQDPLMGHTFFATAPIEADAVLARVPLAKAVWRGSLEQAWRAVGQEPPISQFLLRRSREQLAAGSGYSDMFGLSWWLLAADRAVSGEEPAAAAAARWGRYVQSLPADFGGALAFDDPELEALAGTAAAPLARELRETFDAEFREAERGFLASGADDPFCSLEEWSWAAAMVLSRSFLVDLEGGPRVTLLPGADMLNHDTHSLSRTRFVPAEDAITVVTAVPFAAGDEVTINYGNHTAAEFLTRYGFTPKGEPRSVALELSPWPPEGAQQRLGILGDQALRPHSRQEIALHRRLLEQRGGGDRETLTLFQAGLTAESNFALRLAHLREGAELSAYAISRIWSGDRPFSARNEALMLIHLWLSCERALGRFPGVTMETVGADIELLQGGSLRGPDDGLMRELIRYRLGDKFILASCIENLRPSAAAVLELGPDAVSL